MPCSDGAGEVVAVGRDVKGLSVGDRVATLFFPHWQSGKADARALSDARGAESTGAFTERFVTDESGLIKLPDSLSYPEAATLPCAALTAWNSLFEAGDLKPGQTVLLLGTGGVSIFALQFAKAAGRLIHRIALLMKPKTYGPCPVRIGRNGRRALRRVSVPFCAEFVSG